MMNHQIFDLEGTVSTTFWEILHVTFIVIWIFGLYIWSLQILENWDTIQKIFDTSLNRWIKYLFFSYL